MKIVEQGDGFKVIRHSQKSVAERLIPIVLKYFGATPQNFYAENNKRENVTIRHYLFWLHKKVTGEHYKPNNSNQHGFHRTNILSGYKKIQGWLDMSDRETVQITDDLLAEYEKFFDKK